MIILHYCTVRINKLVPRDQEARSLRDLLDKIVMMYSLSCLEKHLSTFYQGLLNFFFAQLFELKNMNK